jgi:hypothetical protein
MKKSGARWCTPAIQALRRQRQEDHKLPWQFSETLSQDKSENSDCDETRNNEVEVWLKQ